MLFSIICISATPVTNKEIKQLVRCQDQLMKLGMKEVDVYMSLKKCQSLLKDMITQKEISEWPSFNPLHDGLPAIKSTTNFPKHVKPLFEPKEQGPLHNGLEFIEDEVSGPLEKGKDGWQKGSLSKKID